MSFRQHDPIPFEEDPRYEQANREAWWAIGYWLAFTAAVTGLAWWLGYEKPAEELSFILGFPAWFFWSVLATSVVFSVIPAWIIRRHFVDVPLTSDGQPVPAPEGRQ